MNLEGFTQERIRRIEEQYERLDIVLTTNSILLKRRMRSWTASDDFGVFNTHGVWKQIPAKGLHSLNIIKPAVKTTTAAILTAEIKLDVQPRFTKDQNAEMASEVARAILGLKNEQQWTDTLQAQIATEPQVSPGVFLHVAWNPYAESPYEVEEWGDDESEMGGKSVCPACGTEGDAKTEVCPECSAAMEMLEPAEKVAIPVVKDIKKLNAGDTITRIIPACEVLVDNLRTHGGQLDNARYLLHRYLQPVPQVKSEYPNAPTGTADWSLPLRWQYTMETGQELLEKGPFADDVCEVKDFYITPAYYGNEKMDDDFILKGEDGSVRFEVKRGQTLAEAKFEGQSFDAPPCLCVRVIGESIIDIYPADFRKEFVYIAFLHNPAMFYGLFLTELLPLQDAVNHMLTIQMRHTARNARTTKILNSGAFDPEDIEKDIVLTKDPIPYDAPIQNTYGMIPAATLSSEPMNLISLMLSTKGDVGGITPAMQGQSLPNEPYAAQRLQKEQSMGQLTPFLRSIANAKVEWGRQQLALIQQYWPEEKFEFLLDMNPEWDEEYIDAFLKANLDTDLILGYEPGSEAPRNLFDKELALRQFIQDVTMLAQLNPAIAAPELINEILMRIKQFGQIDVDVQNTKAEQRIADSRMDKVKALIEGFNIPAETPPDALKIMATALVAGVPDLQPSIYEDPATQVEFYRDQMNRELAQDDPNFLLIACIEALIEMHEMKAVELAQKQQQMMLEAEAPMREAEQAQMMEQQAMEAEQQAAQAEQAQAMKDEERMMKAAEKEAMDTEMIEIRGGGQGGGDASGDIPLEAQQERIY